MMRMLLEIVMVLAVVGALFFMTKVMAKESRKDAENDGSEDSK
ncbi:hypothetical protein NP590_18935 [Methylomonas sp. SURF-2]|uniref:Uncharacterized protein n=1 Tax=Methylomonas subterranea TaxID=2952225 RepID=A0ABT1TL35_9GAMM|nr:hypothetical protein [Methylomonas sp. SURF-2]MCQ8106191.1 hypothetical protein [Methylomonas sp. SURF-2]